MSALFTTEVPEPILVHGWSWVLHISPGWVMGWTDTRDLCCLRPSQAHSPSFTLETTEGPVDVGP